MGEVYHHRISIALCLALAASLPAQPSLAEPHAPPQLATPGGDLSKYGSRYPKTPQHVYYLVEVNRKGQVSKIRSGTHSQDRLFDSVTYGNVAQTFVRRSDGKAISGLFRVSYDYDPKSQKVTRSVALVHPGGVDAAAPGLVDVVVEINRRNKQKFQAMLHQQKLDRQLKEQLKKLAPAGSGHASPAPR
jgi:hypothetical protein